MNIKQIEELTGMARANIRFYESEGLICPQRKENGYRVYSDEDVEILRKIRLLRSLEISLEEVKKLRSGETSLEAVLRNQEITLSEKQTQLERVREISRLMLSEGAEFGSLDARRYLERLESDWVLGQDREERLNLPWRRYWARDFDYLLCGVAVSWLLPESADRSLLFVMNLALLLFFEPLCLHLFGCTPGKAIFGIRVTDLEGGRLSWQAALRRTCGMLWEGECLRLPVVSMYFHYKSLRIAEEQEQLPWEEESELTFRDEKLWRYVLFFLLTFLIINWDVWSILISEGIL